MDDVSRRSIERFHFNGSAGEYFGIWIVNVLLTILTLGIYSAWAKVRRLRYFYGNTFLARHSFEYHARPIQILIGRIIAIVILAAYNVLVNVNPIAGLFAFLGLLLLLPFLVARGLRFHARVSSYRNVRFDFAGGYGGALVAFIIGPILAALTLGIFAPQASRWHYRYVFNNLRYGGRSFLSTPRLGALYRVWLLPAIVAVVSIVAIFGISVFAGVLGEMETLEEDYAQAGIIAMIYLLMLTLLVSYALAGLFYAAGVRNVVFQATVFDGKHRLESDFGRRRYAWIAITNLLVTMVTFGLMRPWAAVRMARYTWSHTALEMDGDLGTYLSELKDETGVVGAEFTDFEGIDIGF